MRIVSCKRFRQTMAIFLSLLMIATSFSMYPSVGHASGANGYFSNPESLVDQYPTSNWKNRIHTPDPTLIQPQKPLPQNPFDTIQLQQEPSIGVNPTTSSIMNPPASSDRPFQPPVDEATGKLTLAEVDLSLPEINYGIEVKRTYESGNQELGPFGKGWVYPLESKLRLHAEFHMSEFRIDGSTQPFQFVIQDEDAFITSYDDDELINYELDKGYYEVSENGDQLKRISQHEYQVTTAEGNIYTYYGYEAPWRENQPAKEGRLIKQKDRYGNTMTFDYNAAGQVSKITDMVGRTVELSWTGNVITAITDPEGQTTQYTYITNV